MTILDETGSPFRDAHWKDDLARWLGRDLAGADVVHWPAGDLAAGPSSGSYPARGMVVVPASTAACAGIAIGLSKDLLQRAAEVNLKERRRVVVVPRETPVTRSHLAHLIDLHDAGAVVLPASPGFYGAGASASAQQLIDFVAGKVLDALGVPHALFRRWSGELNAPGKP
ncbi:UbiX family flavin prenyltransferase [Phytohabitans rumicis]